MVALGSAAEAAEASWSAQAESISARAGDSLVAPSRSSSSCWRRRLPFCSDMRSRACRRNWPRRLSAKKQRFFVFGGPQNAGFSMGNFIANQRRWSFFFGGRREKKWHSRHVPGHSGAALLFGPTVFFKCSATHSSVAFHLWIGFLNITYVLDYKTS